MVHFSDQITILHQNLQFDGGEIGSVMFKATYNSKTGFVTAGHAFVDDSGNQRSGANIYQSPDQTTDIGNLETNNLFINVATWCDCAFVSELSGSRSMDDGVYSLSDPNSTESPYWNQLVTISGGFTGLSSGYVSNTNYDWQMGFRQRWYS